MILPCPALVEESEGIVAPYSSFIPHMTQQGLHCYPEDCKLRSCPDSSTAAAGHSAQRLR